jgi:site-specific DNA recombinase
MQKYGPDVQWYDDVVPNAPLMGLEVNEEYKRVIQESATGWNRVLFEATVREAIELYREGKVQVVMFPRVDRETRFVFGSFALLSEVIRAGLEVCFAREKLRLDPNDADSVERYLTKAAQAQAYVEVMKQNTIRGKIAKAKQGYLVGGGHNIYGFDYVKAGNEGGNRRVINEFEAEQVRNMFNWLVVEKLAINAIVERLNSMGIPAKHGGKWSRSSIIGILRNYSYTGRTFAFTTLPGKRSYTKPREQWLEAPEATPAIIGTEIFEAAQRQLDKNRIEAKRNLKRFYLLRGHIYCKRCGKAYGSRSVRKDKEKERRSYRCSAKRSLEGCTNRSWSADKLEKIVWDQVEKLLANPEIIIHEVERKRQSSVRLEPLEIELKQIEKRLKALQREQEQLLQWALKGFPEETVLSENKRINSRRETLLERQEDLEKQIEASRNAQIDLEKLTQFVEVVQNNLKEADKETKRLALDALDLKLWVDGENLEITGSIPLEESVIVTERSPVTYGTRQKEDVIRQAFP